MAWLTYSFLSLPLMETVKSLPERIIMESGPQAPVPVNEIVVVSEGRPRQVAVSPFSARITQLSPNHASL